MRRIIPFHRMALTGPFHKVWGLALRSRLWHTFTLCGKPLSQYWSNHPLSLEDIFHWQSSHLAHGTNVPFLKLRNSGAPKRVRWVRRSRLRSKGYSKSCLWHWWGATVPCWTTGHLTRYISSTVLYWAFLIMHQADPILYVHLWNIRFTSFTQSLAVF